MPAAREGRTCSTIEAAHFRYCFVSELLGSLTQQKRRNANLVSKKYVVCTLGPWDYSLGYNLVFAEVSFLVEVWSSSSEERQKN